MLFNSPIFVFAFLPLSLLSYYIFPSKYRNLILIVISVVFYAWGEPRYTYIFIWETIFAFVAALTFLENKNKKFLLGIYIATLLIPLIFFKFNFFFIGFLHSHNLFTNLIPTENLPLPIGISFYTFHLISYLVDSYRDTSYIQTNISKVLLYNSFFPQLVAGPILRFNDIIPQIIKREHTLEKFEQGIIRFTIGLGKKVLLANTLSVPADFIFGSDVYSLTSAAAWYGVIAYALQIYFDFSGYSDMAIGLSKIFGFELKENFNYPYIARSVTDFWQRWHISLTTWFRYYVYFPLGGNRLGLPRTLINIMVVFALSGIWHGSNYTFLIWGLYFGVLLCIERLFKNSSLFTSDEEKDHGVFKDILGWIYTTFAVLIGWVLFRSPSLHFAYIMIRKLFFSISGPSNFEDGYIRLNIVYVLIIGFILSTPLIKGLIEKHIKNALIYKVTVYTICLFIFFISLTSLSHDTYQPFIYFQF